MTCNPPPLTGQLGIRYPYKSRGGAKHDVGGGRMLTARQIAMESGCPPTTIYARLHAGVTGPDLLRPLRVKLYDVGGGERLTISQIARRTGLAADSIRSRMSRGVKGAALLRKERRDMAAPRSSTMTIALRLADQFPDALPTTAQIRKVYPMSDTSAERWLAAMRDARARGEG